MTLFHIKMVNRFRMLLFGIISFGFLCCAQFSVADEYNSLEIFPQKVGVFYQNETQQFRAIGITASGAKVDLTEEVDWYIDPAGYPHSAEQDVSEGAVATIDANGLVTIQNTWGRVVVHVCYPKGCGPNSSQSLTSTLALLLQPSFLVTSGVDETDTDGVISDSQEVKKGRSAVFTLTPTDNTFEASSMDTDCSAGTFSSDRLEYTTGTIDADCFVTAHFTLKPEVTPSVPSGNGTVTPGTAIYVTTGLSTEFTLSPDAGYELLISGVTNDNCGVGAISGLTYTTGTVTEDCTVVFTYTAQPVVTPSVPAGNGSVSPDTATSVATNDSREFTLTPDADYELLISGVTGTCAVGSISGGTYTTGAISADCTVIFAYTAQPEVTPSVPAGNGSVSPDTATSVATNDSREFTLTPDAGFELLISGVTGTCAVGSISGGTYTTGTVTENCTVIFAYTAIPATYLLTVVPNASEVDARGGVLSNPLGDIACDTEGDGIDCEENITNGDDVTLGAIAYSGSQFAAWSGCSTSTNAEITVAMNADKTCTANFVLE